MEWREPESYWQKRAIVAENVINVAMTLLGNAMPHLRAEIDVTTDAWNNTIDELEREFRHKGE